MRRTTVSERALVLAPRGRDAAIAVAMLDEAGIAAAACASLPALVHELNQGAAVVVVTEEALITADLAPLATWIAEQEEWSDLPFVLLTNQGGGIERNPAARRYLAVLGNATFVERPFHPTTLISLVQSALRGRRRQYEARARLEALREGETRLRLATENAEIGFWDVDPINHVLIWPARVKAIFGISPDVAVTMQDFYEGLHPSDRETTAAAYAAATDPQRRALYDVEYRTVGKEDGVVRWVAAKGRGLFDAAGRCVRVIGTAVDVTARKTVEAALRESEARFRLMADAVPQIVWITDAEGRTEFFNKQWSDYTGAAYQTTTAAEIAATFVHPADVEPTMAAFEEARRTGGTFQVEHRIRSKTGEYRWFLVRGEPYRDPSTGLIVRWFGASIDIDDRRHAEAALRESEARLVFLDRLGAETAPLADADAVLAATTRLLGEHLSLSVCAYADMDEDEDGFTIRGDWAASGSKSIVGHYSLADFGKLAVKNLSAGLPLVVNDSLRELAPEEAATFQSIGIAATICMPLVKEGRLTALMAVHDRVPRVWTEAELSLLREVTARSWAHVERVAATAELRENEARLRLVQAAGGIGSFDYDLRKDEAVCSPEYYAILGLPQGHPINREAWTAAIYPDDRHKAVEALDRAIAERAPFDYEYRIVRASDGAVRWLSGRAAVTFGDDGEPWRYVGGNIDVTARKATEERLRDLNESLELRVAEALAERRLLADVIDGTDIFVQVADRDYNWLAINDAAASEFARIFGVDRPKAGDNMLDKLKHRPADRDAVQAVWSRALAGEEFVEINEFGDPTLDRRYYEMRFRMLRDADGCAIGAYQFVSDVTDRLREQTRLREAEEALRQAQKMEAVGQLTGGVAHDFNNLLTIIKSSTELLRRPGLAEERRARYIEAISDTVDRASKLTGQLLAFARRQSLKPEVFNVADRIQAITEMLATIVGSRIQIVTNVSDEPCFVEADVSQFETALVNMAVNARDAMDGEGTLAVKVHQTSRVPAIRSHDVKWGDFVCVAMSDSGAGIPADKLTQIFEPFFTTKEVGKGTGLGLSQVYGFTKQSGGDVSVQSTVGAGTTFTLYLPRIEGMAEQEHAEHNEFDDQPTSVPVRPRVLVVEDNVQVGTFSTQLLQDLGYETTWAPNADEALKLIAQVNGFDVVFSDVIMPGMSGIELGHEIQRRFPGLPVVLTSGYSHVLAEEGRHGFELLHKPYAADELSQVLRRVTHTAN